MAHFAEINNSNVVTRVIVVSNADTSDASGTEKEYIGAAISGAFVPSLQNTAHTSWTMNTSTCQWQSPLGEPPALTDDQITAANTYIWLEHVYAGDSADPKTKGWVLI